MHRLCAVIALATLGTGTPARAADGSSLLDACFAPAALASIASEKAVVKGAGGRDHGPPREMLPPLTPVPAGERLAVRRVKLPPGRKLVALTFDLCEQPGEVAGYDGAILDYLRANRIRATIFAGGRWLTTHRQRAEQMILDPLLEIASHGWGHANVRGLDGPALQREIDGPSLAYVKIRREMAQNACLKPHAEALSRIAPAPTLFRFPFGACNAAALDAVGAAGMRAIQWDVSTGDPWPLQSARAIADIMVSKVQPGSIVLAHANGRGYNTAAALPLAIPRLQAMGYEFVTVSELLAAGTPVLSPTCYDARPGDTDKYDVLNFARGKGKAAGHGWSTTAVPR